MRLLVLGAGGHAKVVADILQRQGHHVLGFLDDAPNAWGTYRLGLPVFGPIDSYAGHRPDGMVLGIGSNAARKAIVRRLGDAAWPLWHNAIDPTAVIAASAQLGVSVVAAAGAIVNPDARIGDHVIINTGASVDHDCIIEEFAHIAPGARLAGAVRVGQGTLIGIGTAVIPGCSIGDWSTVGAGAAVIGDLPSSCTAAGVPARVIERR